jgi:hypothetical protein
VDTLDDVTKTLTSKLYYSNQVKRWWTLSMTSQSYSLTNWTSVNKSRADGHTWWRHQDSRKHDQLNWLEERTRWVGLDPCELTILEIIMIMIIIIIKVKLSLCLTNYALRHEDVWGSGCIDPRFLELGTSWSWVVSFTPRPLYHRGKRPRYALDRRLDETQSQSRRLEKVKILAATGTRIRTPWSFSP